LIRPLLLETTSRQWMGSSTMSNRQHSSSGADADGPAGSANSRWTERRAGESRQKRVAAITAELTDALAREAALLRDKDELMRRQNMLAEEFEHRLVNSLQMIVSLLSLQSRKTESPEAAAQLTEAARRVGAFGRVHRRLHLLDHLATVELRQYVAELCEDISGMLLDGHAAHLVVVEGAKIDIPTRLGIPLSFIVNELITNAAKHAKGKITVRLETTPELGHCLSVSDDGPGLPDGFHPGKSRGLGLKIIQSLVRQIDGRLQVGDGPGQQGACFKVFFQSAVSAAIDHAGDSRRAPKSSADGQGMHSGPA
jgi:two-component sensor histidine kinase